MPKGSCFCGNCSYEYQGEVQAKALCHCKDCRKISGSTYSSNIIVPGEGFQVTSGKPKSITKKGDNTGNEITSYFCGDCGSTMWRAGKTFGDAKVVKVGTLDDDSALENNKPGIELYAGLRPSWVEKIPGAGQKKDMPDSADME